MEDLRDTVDIYQELKEHGGEKALLKVFDNLDPERFTRTPNEDDAVSQARFTAFAEDCELGSAYAEGTVHLDSDPEQTEFVQTVPPAEPMVQEIDIICYAYGPVDYLAYMDYVREHGPVPVSQIAEVIR